MKTNFTPNQIKWASDHSWFVSATDQAVTVRNVMYCSATKVTEVTVETLTSFKALRDWAGY